jgi:hypothetical protein
MKKSLLLLPALGLLLVSCSATSATGNLVIATGSLPELDDEMHRQLLLQPEEERF